MADDTATEGTTDGSEPAPAAGERLMHQVAPPTGMPVYYANNVAFRTTFWDFTMDLGTIVEVSEERLVVQGAATVIMSPQHAQIFHEVLGKQLHQYREKFGPIPRAPNSDEVGEEPADE
jgi:hypothetical protein